MARKRLKRYRVEYWWSSYVVVEAKNEDGAIASADPAKLKRKAVLSDQEVTELSEGCTK